MIDDHDGRERTFSGDPRIPTISADIPPHLTNENVQSADDTTHRSRALISQGTNEDDAIKQASNEPIEFARRAAYIARQRKALIELADTYQVDGGASTYRLLRDLGNHLGVSLAYIDRKTVEAHLERALSDTEWSATNAQFTALDFDNYIGDQNTVRTDWIETVLDKAGLTGYGHAATGAPIAAAAETRP